MHAIAWNEAHDIGGRLMRRLGHQVAVVTGGASGIGKAVAQRLVADGLTVVISDTQVELGCQAASEGGFTFLEHDVCDESRWIALIEEVEKTFGQLDVLVNNAGVLGRTDAVSPENTLLEEWKKIFAVNVEGVFLGCQAAIPAMRRAGGGSIVNMSSIAGLLATPYASAYGASKAAVRQFTKSVAQYCAQERLNIRCNSVHPGVVRTPLWERQAQAAARARNVSVDVVIAEAKARIPMGEFTQPEEIAAVVAFLASDASRHITGSKLIVDGGVVNCDTYGLMSPKVRERQ